MPEENDPPMEPAPEETPATPGYFNRRQLDDIDEAEAVLTAALSEGERMSEQDIDEPYLTGFGDLITEAHNRTATAGMEKDEAKTDTEEAIAAREDLHTALRKIQSSAKQKHRMLAEDGDPTTNFPLDGYLIGTRINATESVLCQSAASLITRIKEDSIPGFKTPEKIQDIEDLLTEYEGFESSQQTGTVRKEVARLTRDQLIDTLNTRRSAIQFAADAIWPFNEELNRPIRKSFRIPQDRPMSY